VANEKKYTVTTPNYETTLEVWKELTADTSESERIPARPVSVSNERASNPRNTEYWLTDEEAKELRQDPRVQSVEQLETLALKKSAFQSGNFSKAFSSADEEDIVNWGLIRHIQNTDTFNGNDLPSGSPTYDYVLDGTGVDVVIVDSGIQPDHPDFHDADGVSRVRQIDWFTESGVSGSMPTDFYTDFDGHGTQCASIVAGKINGWAKNADIYAIKLDGLQGASDPNGGISIADTFDCILGWHNNKTNGRPTVINNSWGLVVYWNTDTEELAFDTEFTNTTYAITGGSYRGTPWTGGTFDNAKGHVGAVAGSSNIRQMPYRSASIDADVQTLANANVVLVNAAGNEYQKIDVVGGVDYDNYVAATGLSDYYYHRGTSPFSPFPEGFEVPAMAVNNISGEFGTVFSNKGPATPVYAAGESILAANIFGFVYYGNTGNFYYSVSGTSFAAPQIAGMAALLLQMHPDWTPQQVTKWFVDNAAKDQLRDTGLDDDYTANFSLLAGENNVAFFPNAGQRPFEIS